MQNKNFSGDGKEFTKVFLASEKSKVMYTDNSLEFDKSREDISWNLRTSTSHRSETNDIAERAIRKVKEGTSAVLLQSDLDEKWGLILRNTIDICEKSKTSWHIGRLHRKRVSQIHWKVQYHSDQNDYRYISFVFELIKIVIFEIWYGTIFWIN